MSKKTPHKDTSEKLFKLQDQLFELHGRVQELRHRHAMYSTSRLLQPMNAIVLAIQAAGEIDRLLDQVADLTPPAEKGGGK